MTWKKRSPGANRRRRARAEKGNRSLHHWYAWELRVWASMGASGAELRRCAKASARYVVSGKVGDAAVVMANMRSLPRA